MKLSSVISTILSPYLLAVTVSIFLGLPLHANAAPAFAVGCGGPLFVNCIYSNDSIFAKVEHFGSGPAERSFSVRAEASAGIVRAFATASANDAGGQISTSQAGFSDIVTFVAPGNTALIMVNVTLMLDGVCSGSPGSFAGYVRAGCGVQMNVTAGRGLNTISPTLNASGEVSQMIQLRPGDDLPFDVFLQVQGLARYGAFVGNFANTGRLALSTSTPGVTFASASGYDYSLSAVPEPATLLQLVLGIFVLFCLAQMRSKPNWTLS